jgi:hypothetical protein
VATTVAQGTDFVLGRMTENTSTQHSADRRQCNWQCGHLRAFPLFHQEKWQKCYRKLLPEYIQKVSDLTEFRFFGKDELFYL